MRARAFFLVLCSAAFLGAEEPVSNPAITAAELLGHIKMLASDEWEGRGAGTPGEARATQYIAGQFARLGLEPAGENGTFFQDVRMAGPFSVDASCRLEMPGAAEVALELNKDWRPLSASTSGTMEGDAVFAGYGITAPKAEYDDYAGVDVAGKVVFVLRGTPRGPAWRSREARMQATFVAKLAQAVKRGAIALVVVNNPRGFPPRPEGQRRPRGWRPDTVQRRGVGNAEPRIGYAHMTLAAARRFFPALLGATPDELEKAIHAEEKPAPVSRAGKQRVRLHTKVERTWLTGRNVCGLLRANAEGALDEMVVVGAHHDHLGKSSRGSLAGRAAEGKIHNGADDNASGTSGVLEVAEYLVARRGELRRSVLFLTFTGEERGLLGSRHFVEHPTHPLAKMIAMVNMDMIGRLEKKKLFIGGVKTSPAFKPMLERHAAEAGLAPAYGDGGRAPSDNSSFYAKKMPVLFFFTGMHPDYHRPGDTWDKIDTENMEKVARYAAAMVDDLARMSERPKFQKADQGGFGPPRASIGISIGAAENGILIQAVTPNGAAAKAGLKAGDVIIEVAGEKTPDLRALRRLMRRRQIGDQIKVKVRREDAVELEVTVTLTAGQGR